MCNDNSTLHSLPRIPHVLNLLQLYPAQVRLREDIKFTPASRPPQLNCLRLRYLRDIYTFTSHNLCNYFACARAARPAQPYLYRRHDIASGHAYPALMVRVSFTGSTPDLHVALDEGASVQNLLDQVRCLSPAPLCIAYCCCIFSCELSLFIGRML